MPWMIPLSTCAGQSTRAAIGRFSCKPYRFRRIPTFFGHGKFSFMPWPFFFTTSTTSGIISPPFVSQPYHLFVCLFTHIILIVQCGPANDRSATLTGLSTAVSQTPYVLPDYYIWTTVIFRSAEFVPIAHLGLFDVNPSSLWCLGS